MPVLPTKAGWGSTFGRTLLLLVACAACSRTAWERSNPQARAPAPKDQAIGTGAEGGDRHPWRGRRHRPLPRPCLAPCPLKCIKSRLEWESNSGANKNIIRLEVPFLVQMSFLGRLLNFCSKGRKARSGTVRNMQRKVFGKVERAGARLARSL